jgi:hypothetical protein
LPADVEDTGRLDSSEATPAATDWSKVGEKMNPGGVIGKKAAGYGTR